jgi:hypothetical protein
MGDGLAGANVNRAYSLAAMSVAILTFLLIFLFPRYERGEIDSLLFQVTLVILGLATFAFVFATINYYAASLDGRMDETARLTCARRGDRAWLAGYTLLLLAPGLVLLQVGLDVVAAVWLVLWLGYLLFAMRFFPRVRSGG